MAHVLVVGGAGYIGSVVVRELLERGYAVRVLDRLYFGGGGLEGVRDRVELVVGDMRAADRSIFDHVDSVINVGGLSNDPTAEFNPTANFEMNTTASVSLARMAKEAGVKRYLYASSCSIYDRGILDESRDVLLDEEAEVDPPGAYAGSKLQAEQALLPMSDQSFCVVALRKATLFGFSPRMRYDLVVNTFVRDAMAKGFITLHIGGEMWRPLAEVRDAARAYAVLLEAEPARVGGQVFNLVHRNYRISELALRVREALRSVDVPCDVRPEYSDRPVRNYRVTGRKLESTLRITAALGIEDSVRNMVDSIRRHGMTDFDHPRYYNISWMRMLEEANEIVAVTGSVFGSPSRPPRVSLHQEG